MKDRKEKIKEAFSRSADTYDRYADIQKETARYLIEMLYNVNSKKILELGCATGHYSLMLAKEFPSSEITSIDFSGSMIKAAKSRLSSYSNVKLIHAEAEEFLSSGSGPFDLITSNATVHWFSDVISALGLTRRLLGKEGLFVCSVFGRQTFNELALALKAIHDDEILLPASTFPTRRELGSALKKLFRYSYIRERNLTRKYPSAFRLLKQIKNTGTSGGGSQPPVLMTRSTLKQMDSYFTKHYGECRVTYQVFIVKART